TEISFLSPLHNAKKSPPFGGLFFALLRPLCGLEPLPPYRTLKFAVSIVAAEKNADLACGKWWCSAAKAFFKRRHGVPKAGQVPSSAALPPKRGKSLLVTCDKLPSAPYYVALIDAGNKPPETMRLLGFFHANF
ncbi:MAG: hypothetical protein IJF45_05005, partial [Clostridia bacterium]|nr:hypothetical protein [Clostridia bacterium]